MQRLDAGLGPVRLPRQQHEPVTRGSSGAGQCPQGLQQQGALQGASAPLPHLAAWLTGGLVCWAAALAGGERWAQLLGLWLLSWAGAWQPHELQRRSPGRWATPESLCLWACLCLRG